MSIKLDAKWVFTKNKNINNKKNYIFKKLAPQISQNPEK